MNFNPDWLKVLYRPGRLLQAQELIHSQLIASRQIGLPFQYLIGYYRVLQGLAVVIHINELGVKSVRVSPGKIATVIGGEWRVIYIPPFELFYQEGLYIGLLISTNKANLEPDPALGGPILGLLGNPLERLTIQVTTKLNQGLPLAEVINDKVYLYQAHLPLESQYDDLLRELRFRLYEEIGDFIYQGFTPTLITPQLISFSPGVAYINGQRVQTYSPQVLSITGPRAYLLSNGEINIPPIGNIAIRTGRVVISGGGLVMHRVSLPILIRFPITDLQEVTSLPRLELAQLLPFIKESPYRLIPGKLIHELYRKLLDKKLAQPEETLADEYHPLYTARLIPKGITLGRYLASTYIEPYIPPHSSQVYAWQSGVTEYLECPLSLSPYLEFKDQLLTGYNLPSTPLALTCKGVEVSPVSVITGQVSNNLVTSVRGHISFTLPFDCLSPGLGPYRVSSSPLLDNGFAQEFEALSTIQVKGFSFVTQDSFTGLVVVSSGNTPLGWVGVTNQLGEIYVEFDIPISVIGVFRVCLITNQKTLVGVYDLNSNLPRDEGVFSRRLLLSVNNNWLAIPNKDLACELFIAKGLPNSEYETNISISHEEAFDGIALSFEHIQPTGSSISLNWFRDGSPIVDLDSFYPISSLSLNIKAKLSPNGSVPIFKGGQVSLFITREESTWVGRDEETNKIYNQALVLIEYYAPEGTSIKPYLSSDSGRTWFGFDEVNITKLTGDKYLTEYRAIDLPISLLITDVNGEAYTIPRTKGRVRVDLSTQQPQVRPIVFDVKAVYSYA